MSFKFPCHKVFLCLRPMRKLIKKIMSNEICCSFMSNNHLTNTHETYLAHRGHDSREEITESVRCLTYEYCLISRSHKRLNSLFPSLLTTKGRIEGEQKASINLTKGLSDIKAFDCHGVHFCVHAYLSFSVFTFFLVVEV